MAEPKKQLPNPTNADFEAALRVIDWLQALPGDQNYAHASLSELQRLFRVVGTICCEPATCESAPHSLPDAFTPRAHR